MTADWHVYKIDPPFRKSASDPYVERQHIWVWHDPEPAKLVEELVHFCQCMGVKWCDSWDVMDPDPRLCGLDDPIK